MFKIKSILFLLGVCELLVLGFRWFVTHSTLVGMISMTTFTVGSVGKNYIERVKTNTNNILISKKPLIIHDSILVVTPVIHDTLVKEDSIYVEKIKYVSRVQHDTLIINNVLYDTIKGSGQPIIKGDTVIFNFTHTNPKVHVFKNYVFSIRPHREKTEIHVK